jgi:hypothetical protein
MGKERYGMKLSELFRWHKKIEIKNGNDVVSTVYIRLVGDRDYQDARLYALKDSKDMRIKLRNSESPEYQSSFFDLNSMTKEELVNTILYSELPLFRDDAVVKYPDKEPIDMSDVSATPDNPSLEDQEKLLSAKKKQIDDRVENLTKYMEQKSNERREALNKLSIDDIKNLYKEAAISVRCNEIFTTTFRDYQVYRGTFDDVNYTSPSFSSFEELKNASPLLKSQLVDAYTSLEINGEDLKN